MAKLNENTDLKNKLTKKESGNTVIDLIGKMKNQIQMALPKHLNADRIIRIATTAIRINPLLGQCESQSLLGALMQCAQLGLEPNTPLGQAYLIPFKNGKTGQYQCQLIIGYKGILDLCFRTNEYKMIYAYSVLKEDVFDYEYGLHPFLKHKPSEKRQGNPIKYYAVYHLRNGGEGFVVWNADEIKKHAERFSKSFKSGPWQTDFDPMAKKTVLIDLLKYAPKSIELNRQLSIDETVNEVNEDLSDVVSIYPEQSDQPEDKIEFKIPGKKEIAEKEDNEANPFDNNFDPGFTPENIQREVKNKKEDESKSAGLLFRDIDTKLPPGVL
jgi:recombination protein RecT